MSADFASDSSALPTALDGVMGPPSKGGKESGDRFKDVGAAYSAYKEARQGDQLSAMNRIRYQMKLDGEPPYSKQEMRKYGLATNANVNFGFMEDVLTAASAPYEDLVDGSEVLMRLPTKFGNDPAERMGWESVMEEEYTTLITDDDGFDYQLAELVRQFNLHGIAVPFRENEYEISWRTTETGNFLLPRDCRASTKAIDWACCVREYLPHELWERIEDRDTAKELGWDIKETMEAIKAATPGIQWDDDWDKWTEQWKNNDFGMSYSGRPSVTRVVHMWYVSRDGKSSVTHCMFRADGAGKEFMFKAKDRFSALGEAFTIFTDGVGTNGKYHGIRGIGYKLYAIIKELDELWSSFIDATRQAGKIFIQPQSEAAAKNLALVEWGNFIMLPPKANFIDRTLPNYAQNLIPGINLLGQLLERKSGQYTTQGAFDQKKEQTAREIMARLDQIAKLSTTKVKIFYNSWERLNKENVRRIIRKDWHPSDPDYERVNQFYTRCEARGVPKEAIYEINLRRVKAVKAMGNGSPEARQAILDRLMQLFQYYDPEGQGKLVRVATISAAGKDMGDMLAPQVPGQRPPIDKKIADLENAAMGDLKPQVVEPNENHAVHMVEHLTGPGGLLEMVQAFRAGQVGYEAVPAMRLKHTHCDGNEQTQEIGHMQFIPDKNWDGTPNMQKAQFKEALQQTDEIIANGERHLQAEQRKMQEAEGQEQEAIGATDSRAAQQAEESLFQVQQEAATHEANLRMKEEDHQQAIRQKQESFAQEQALQKARTEADIALKAQQEAAKITAEPQKEAA